MLCVRRNPKRQDGSIVMVRYGKVAHCKDVHSNDNVEYLVSFVNSAARIFVKLTILRSSTSIEYTFAWCVPPVASTQHCSIIDNPRLAANLLLIAVFVAPVSTNAKISASNLSRLNFWQSVLDWLATTGMTMLRAIPGDLRVSA